MSRCRSFLPDLMTVRAVMVRACVMLTSFLAFLTDSFELDLIPCRQFYLVMERMLQWAFLFAGFCI